VLCKGSAAEHAQGSLPANLLKVADLAGRSRGRQGQTSRPAPQAGALHAEQSAAPGRMCPWTQRLVRQRYRALRQAARACWACSLAPSRANPLVCASLFSDSESLWCIYHGGHPCACCGACCAPQPFRLCPTPQEPAWPAGHGHAAAERRLQRQLRCRRPRPALDRLTDVWGFPPYLFHPNSSVSATIATITGSKDAPDEHVLPPVPISPSPNRGPYNITNDLIMKHPQSDKRIAEQASFIDVQVPK
jgi:hypothetical protein